MTLADEDTNSIITDNANGAIWWPNLQLMHVMESISGSIVPLTMFFLKVYDSSKLSSLCMHNVEVNLEGVCLCSVPLVGQVVVPQPHIP